MKMIGRLRDLYMDINKPNFKDYKFINFVTGNKTVGLLYDCL